VARDSPTPRSAAELVTSEALVKTHVNRLLVKLDLCDRVQAVVLAYETGFAQPRTQPEPATDRSRRLR
jgi:hypothetical protein